MIPTTRQGRQRPAVTARPACGFGGLTLALSLAVAFAHAPAAHAPAAESRLAAVLHQQLQQSCFAHAQWGVLVVDATSSSPVFATNAHRLLKPASNAKLFTGALVLDQFGPDHRIPTDLIPTGSLTRKGTLRGDLVVFGRGDFSTSTYYRDDPSHRPWQPLADALAHAGIRRIRGSVIADDSCFQGPPQGSGWTWEDLQHAYGAEAGALNADDNVVQVVLHPGPAPGAPLEVRPTPDTRHVEFDLRLARTGPADAPAEIDLQRALGSRVVTVTGSLPAAGPPSTHRISVPNCALFYARRLTDELARRGIRVRGEPRHLPGAAARLKSGAASWPPVLHVGSPPLAEMVRAMMKPSNNLYAQSLLLLAGAHAHESFALPPGTSTEAAGRRALESFLERAGIPREEVLLDDGAGLSRTGLVTPAAIVALLHFMDRHPSREVFRDSLPVAGRDGTLRRRFHGTTAEGNVRAKTGSLRYVSALSGYLTNRAGTPLIFSAMLNAYDPPPGAPSGREALDALVRTVADSGAPPDSGADPAPPSN